MLLQMAAIEGPRRHKAKSATQRHDGAAESKSADGVSRRQDPLSGRRRANSDLDYSMVRVRSDPSSTIPDVIGLGPTADPRESAAEQVADAVLHNGVMSPAFLDRHESSTPTHARNDKAPAHVAEALRSPAQPIEPTARAYFEARFEHDFSKVRIHSNLDARVSAKALSARAYTVGQHIVLAESPLWRSHLLAHELAHIVAERGEGRERASSSPQLLWRSPGPGPVAIPGTNFTSQDAVLLEQARTTLKPKGDAIVGVLVPEGGKPIFLQSGGGQGYNSHVEGKATAKMVELGIKKARLIVELEPCQICDRSVYPGPDVPTEGVTGSRSGKTIPLQTSKINTALPPGSKLTVVGPESTGVYVGVNARIAERPPAVPPIEAHPDPRPRSTGSLPGSQAAKAVQQPSQPASPTGGKSIHIAPPTPAPLQAGVTQDAKAPTPAIVPSPRLQGQWKAGIKAGGKALGWALIFAGLDYLVQREQAKQLEREIDLTRPHMMKWALRLKAKTPDKPVYVVFKVALHDYMKYIFLLGWMPDRQLGLASVGVFNDPVDPPTIEVADRSWDFWRPGKTTTITYSELLIP